MIIVALLFLGLVRKSYGLYSVEFLSLLIFFLYGFSLEIDHYIFGIDKLEIFGLQELDYNSQNYLIIRLLYLSFMLGFTVVILAGKRKSILVVNRSNKILHKILLLLWSLSLLYLAYKLFGLNRLEKMSYITSVKYFHYFAMIGAIYSVGVLWIYSTTGTIATFEKLLLLAVFLYGIMDGGRELFIYLFLGIIPLLKKNRRAILSLASIGLIAIMLILWKPMTAAYYAGLTLDEIYSVIITNTQLSLSGIDPKPSLLLISNYLDGSKIFEGMNGSYLFNMFGQIGSAIGLFDYTSLARTVMLRVNQSLAAEGAGLAFSGILESLMNFWIVGPFILGVILATLIRLSRSSMNVNMLYIYLALIALKIVRTELMVVFKLYGIPILICAITFMMTKVNKNEIF